MKTDDTACHLAGLSPAEILARKPDPEIERQIGALTPEKILALPYDWAFWGRPEQHAPAGRWHIWLILAGRGFGKTRAGAEWVRIQARKRGKRRIALVGATMAEARSVMVEGESGLLNIGHPDERPDFEPSLGRLTWRSGVQGFLHGAADPNGLRGPQFDSAWTDEIGKWPKGEEAWSNLMFALRLGAHPRVVATTTPRRVPLIQQLVGAPGVVLTQGRTRHNRAHLAPGFIETLEQSFGGTRIGRQELDGELIEDIEGSLWPRALLESCQVDAAPALARIVIGVDPPAGASARSDACGIIVAGLGADGRGYVLDDRSVGGERPEGWARKVVHAANQWQADRVIVEANQGGAMVETVLRAVEQTLPLRLVHASIGKGGRAEPIAALYEAGRVSHVGPFPALEDEMTGLVIAGDYAGPGRSPDRADALVWALAELLLARVRKPGVRRLFD
jgi:phage terminase large subunit-like protein